MKNKTIGILGGMGPEATAYFFLRLTKKTPAKKDQEHFRVIVDSNPSIPDRTLAILEDGASPVAAMVETGKNLERAGADIACIPCFTAHYYFDEVQTALSLPLLHIFEVLYEHLIENYSKEAVIGILATTGTLQSGLFEEHLPGFSLLYPDTDVQENRVMEGIYNEEYGIKGGGPQDKAKALFLEAAEHLFSRGAEVVLYGCTEIGAVMGAAVLEKPGIDPMELLIDALIQAASGPGKEEPGSD